MKTFTTGAQRGTDAESERYDLISPVAMRRLAATYAEGAAKYSPHNWRKGIPASDLLNHALRHVWMYLDGDRGEDHLAHAIWNLVTLCHFEETRPELIDIPTRQTAHQQQPDPAPTGTAEPIKTEIHITLEQGRVLAHAHSFPDADTRYDSPDMDITPNPCQQPNGWTSQS